MGYKTKGYLLVLVRVLANGAELTKRKEFDSLSEAEKAISSLVGEYTTMWLFPKKTGENTSYQYEDTGLIFQE